MKLSRKTSTTTSKPAGLPSVNLPVGLAMAGIAAAAAVLWVAMSGYEVLEWMKRHPIDCGLVVATDAHPCASA